MDVDLGICFGIIVEKLIWLIRGGIHVFFISTKNYLMLSSKDEAWLVTLMQGVGKVDMFDTGSIPSFACLAVQSAAFSSVKSLDQSHS